ncbi:MAG TPA: YqgE/AlgH family protein [Polyangiaceae bacterium]|jgi:putative transcriptional regulator
MNSMLAPGLLLAAPRLGDPNFDRSVVLLAAHGDEGGFGWVLNGRTSMSLDELVRRAGLEPSQKLPGSARVGGPVASDQVWLLYRSEERLAGVEDQFEVAPGITASASRKALEQIAENGAPESLITLVGYAGWAPKQLANEIRFGSWLPSDVTAATVFDVASSELWSFAYGRLGVTPMSFTTRTVGSA